MGNVRPSLPHRHFESVSFHVVGESLQTYVRSHVAGRGGKGGELAQDLEDPEHQPYKLVTAHLTQLEGLRSEGMR